MRIALVQLASSTEVDENLAAIEQLTHGLDVDLIVLPEAVMHDFGTPTTPLGPVAQPLDGPFVAALAGIAKSQSTTVVGGMFERSDDPQRPYNTLVAVGPDGDLVGSYRKVHLYDSFGYRESDRMLAGEPTPALIEVQGLTLGLMTCYDLRFPEHARALVSAGADVVVLPAAWVRGPLKEDHWETLVRARAIENTVYVAAAGQCGSSYCGRSMLVDPLGIAVVAMGDQQGRVVGDIDPAVVSAARERNPALRHRREWNLTSGAPSASR